MVPRSLLLVALSYRVVSIFYVFDPVIPLTLGVHDNEVTL